MNKLADQIGPVTLDNVQDATYSKNIRNVSLRGFFDSRVKWNQLNELFALSEQAVVNQKLGGRYVYVDLTEGERNVQYCLFDHDKALDGWYVLKAHRYDSTQFNVHWPWAISLFFLGTDAIRQRGYALQNLEDLTNDWES